MKRAIRLLAFVACGLLIAACGGDSEVTDPTRPFLIVEIDKTPPDTMMRIEVFNVPLDEDGRLAMEYFVGIRIGSGGYTTVQPLTMFRFGHLCSRPWVVTLNRIDPGQTRPTRLDRKEGTGC